MRSLFIAAIAAVSALAFSAPAEASRYYNHGHGQYYNDYQGRSYRYQDEYYQPRYRSQRSYRHYRDGKRYRHYRGRDRYYSDRRHHRGHRYNHGYHY